MYVADYSCHYISEVAMENENAIVMSIDVAFKYAKLMG